MKTWQAWTYDMAKGRAFRVMDEAILLRDDGLELCARVAQRREETGPPWAILAIWWFWAGRCRASQGTLNSLQEFAMNTAEYKSQQLAHCTEMQALAAERTLIPVCVSTAWLAWVLLKEEARAAQRDRRLGEAMKRPEMMMARSSVFLGRLEQCLYLQTSISAWLRYVAVSQMERNQGELQQARTTYKIALQEHNAALDVAGLKYEESLEKKTLELKEAEQRYTAATASRQAAGEALKQTVDLAEEHSYIEAEERFQSEAQKYEVALEAQALRLRTTEDHLAAEKQAAEETEALVMQRHQAALQALETKHQLGLKHAEQKIQRALEKHRSDIEMRYTGEADKRHQAAMAEVQLVLERQRSEMESLERREELLTQQEQLAAARWTAEMDDLRHAATFQQEIHARQREGQLEEAAKNARLTTKHELGEVLMQREVMQEAAELECRALLQSASQQEEMSSQSRQAELQNTEQKHRLALKLSEQKIQMALDKHRAELEARYGDLLLEKAKENLELEMKQQEKSEEMAQNFQNEIVKLEAAVEAGQIKYQLSVEKYTNLLEAVQQKNDHATEILQKEMEERHVTALADVDHKYSHAMAQREAALQSAEVRLQLAEEKFQHEVFSMQSTHEFALDKLESDLEERHVAALSSAQQQQELLEAAENWAREKHQISEEAAERKEQNAAQRLTKELETLEMKHQLAIQRHEDEVADLKFQHDVLLKSRDAAITTLSAKLKQTEARHAKALEAAEEKFRKAFDRVKRAAIEEARQQILEHRRQCKACQQEPLPLPPPLPALPAAPQPEPELQPQLTPARMREVAPLDLRYVESTLESLTVHRSKAWLWAQDLQRVVDQGIEGILELHQAMLLLLEQAARHSLLQGQEDPRAESRILSVKHLVTRVTQVNNELQALRSARADFWFLLHQTSEEAVQYLRQANSLPAPGPAVVKRLDHEVEELCSDQKRMAEAFSELAMRLKTAGKSLDSLQEARGSLAANPSEEAQALDAAGADAQDLLHVSGEVVSALLRDLRDLFYLVDGSNLRPRLRPHPSMGAEQSTARPSVHPLLEGRDSPKAGTPRASAG